MHQTASGGRFALTRASSASPPLGSALHGPHAATLLVSPPPSKTLNGNHIVLAQISNLVSQITKRNYRQTSQELSLLSTNYGNTATLAVFKNLLSKIDLKSARDQPKMQLLLQALDALSQRSNFVTHLCQAFEDMEPLPHDFLHKFSKALKLSSAQDLLLGVSLVHSHRPICKAEGLKFLKSKLTELPSILKEKLSDPLLHELVLAIHNPNFDAKLREASLKYLLQLYRANATPTEPLPHILTLLTEDDTMLDARLAAKSTELSESNAALKQIVATMGPAHVMKDVGYACSQDENTLKVILRQFGRVLDEAKVARILAMMSATHTGLEEGIPLALFDNTQSLIDTTALASSKATTWNLDVFIAAIASMCPKLDWLNVMHNLDFPEFQILDLQGFQLIVSAFTKATSQPFPYHILLSKWRNLMAQFNMIKFATQTLAQQSNSELLATLSPLSNFQGRDALLAASPSPLSSAFASVGLVNALLAISEESGFYAPVAQFLEEERSFILLLSLVEAKGNALLKDDLVTQLCSQLLISSEEENPLKWSLVKRIWSLNQLAIVDTMIHMYNKSSEQLESILECCSQLECLESVLNLVPYTLFAMDLSVLASSSQLLDLNLWIKSMIVAHSDVFVRSILQYISGGSSSATSPQNNNASTGNGLSSETMDSLLHGIKKNEALLSSDAKSELDVLLPASSTTTVAMATSVDQDHLHLPPGMLFNPPKTGSVSQSVPVTQLPSGNGGKGTTGTAPRGGSSGGSGSGQQSQRSGASASQNTSGSASSGSSSGGSGGAQPPPGGNNNNNGDGGSGGSGGPPNNSLISALQNVEQPDEDTRDRIHFILNNVSANNMTTKAADLRAVLKPQFFDYFAAHLVVHRVSNDSRFQSLYLELIDHQRQPDLFHKVLKMSYVAVHAILNSPKLSQSSERTQLKNLGFWIGSMTLARNRPVMYIDIAIKELILKAYEQGTLYAILPFVSRILYASNDSKVFHVPNPWIVMILRLLKEIHSHPRAQQNIKFEIELLFQHINEDLTTIPPTELLLTRAIYNGPNMKDFIADGSSSGTSGASSTSSTASSGGASGTGQSALSMQPAHVPGSINWMPQLHISAELVIFSQPLLKQRLHNAFNKAIDDLIPEAENTVSIVPKTTLRLVLKDFANEPDENKVLTAARSMAQSLASSLLHATLRNHIRTATHNIMKASLEVKAQYDTIQPQFHRAIDENLEVACSVMAKHVVERTIHAVEHELRPAVEARILHRDQLSRGLTTRPFSDQSQLTPQYAQLPEMLKVRPGSGATSQQTQLYDVFLRLPSLIQSSLEQQQQQHLTDAKLTAAAGVGGAAQGTSSSAAGTAASSALSGSNTSSQQGATATAAAAVGGQQQQASGGISGASGIHGPKEYLDPRKVLEKLEVIVAELERWASTVETSIEAAPDAQAAMAPLPKLTMTVVRETQDRAAVATQCALRVFDTMYTNARSVRGPEPNSMREMYARILFALARSTPAVVEALTKRYISANAGEATASSAADANKSITLESWHKELTYALLNWQLLRCDLLDAALAAEVARGNRQAVEFCLWLAKCAILGTHDASGNPVHPHHPHLLQHQQQQGGASAQQQQQQTLPSVLSGVDLQRTLAELDTTLSRSRSTLELALVQSCAQVALDVNTQSRRTATHTDQLHPQASKRPGAASSASQRQQQLLLRQQLLAKTLPQPVVALFSDWVNLWQHGTPTIEMMQPLLVMMRNLGLCSFGDATHAESESHFLRGVIDAAVLAYLMQSQMQAHAQASLQPGAEPTPEQATYLNIQPYAAIDALAKLVVFLVKNYPEPARIVLLQRVLHQTSTAAAADYASNVAEFNQRPYFRLLSSLLVHMSDPIFGEKLESLFLSAFADLLLELRPQLCPGFAFAWLELVSHRMFMPKLIRHPRACFALQKLLIYHLTFLEPYLAASKLNEAVSSLYQGTLRVFLVLIHDFPEFLCDFHHSFCDVLPPSCIQLRNLILSAFPRNVKLPDPTMNIKMEQLPASKESPRVYNIEAELQASGLRERADEVLKGSASSEAKEALFAALPTPLLFNKDQNVPSKLTTYNVKLINSIVLYCGIYAIADPLNNRAMDIYLHLAHSLDAEGRYHLFNAFANQLRYPSSHTHYFSWALLHIFSEASNEAIPEQITRVLLERYIAQKPTPWGLAITYQELTKNQAYNFWARDFVKASPDIGRLFMNLSRRSNPR